MGEKNFILIIIRGVCSPQVFAYNSEVKANECIDTLVATDKDKGYEVVECADESNKRMIRKVIVEKDNFNTDYYYLYDLKN